MLPQPTYEELEKKLIIAQQSANIGWWEYDIQANQIAWSDEVYEMFGIARDKAPLTIERLLEYIDPGYHHYHSQQVELLLATGSADFEYPVNRPDGKTIWIYSKGNLRTDTNGKPTHFSGVTKDITQRKLSEIALKDSEEKFRLIFTHSADAHVLYKTDQFIDCNEASLATLGFESKEQLLSLHPADISPERQPDGQDSKKKAEAMIALAFEKGSHRFEWLCQRKDGSRLLLNVLVNAIRIGGEPLIHGVWRDITQYKQVEETLRESEEKHRLLYENAGLAIGYWTPDGKVISFNKPAAEHMAGRPEQFIGKSANELFGSELGAVYIARIKKAAETAQQQNYEDTVVLPSGTTSLLSTYNAILNSHGEVQGVQIISTEITELYRIQGDLKASEERSKKLFTSNPLPTFIWNFHDGQFLLKDINKAAEILTEGKGSQFLGLSAKTIYPDRPDILQHLSNCLTERRNIVFQTEYLARGTGLHRNIIFTFVYIADDTIMLHTDDITERKLAEEALRENESQLQNLLQTIQAGVIVHDVVKDRVKSFNQSALKSLGVTEEQLLERGNKDPEWGFIGENGMPLTVEEYPVNIVERTQKPLLNYIMGMPHPSGQQPTWVIVKATPQCNQNGELTEVIVSSMDITELKKTQDQLRDKDQQLIQAQKMEAIGNLAGGIAHDFNNILSSILGFTELALEASPAGSSLRDDLEEVRIAGNRAKELVQQILAFARQSEEQKKPVRLCDIVTETLKLLRPSTPTNIAIEQNIASTAKVMGNTSQLHQIVMNLCTNSIHSLESSGGMLKIGLEDISLANDYIHAIQGLPAGEYVELTVTDNGSGIDADIIEQIFEPYFTTKGVGKGTGMGLAMVKGIIEGYGGNISVTSEPGIQTSFVIRLPVITGKSSATEFQADPAESGTGHILFVDDEPPIARMGSRMLEKLGYRVTMRTSSFEALELFREKPDAFDLVITDMTMPSMTGDVLLIELRKIRSDIPVILCTGYSNKINEEGAKQIGIDAFAYKPFTKSGLAKTVRQVLDSRQSSSG